MIDYDSKYNGNDYFPEEVEIIEKDGNIILADKRLMNYENGYICTLGHEYTDLPKGMLKSFLEKIAKAINNRELKSSDSNE